MIVAALRVLANDSARRVEQSQVFAVFEDEAQDSTPLQTQLLTILATDPDSPQSSPPNIIRVGDPNQAINSTFTPADPIYFRRFCQECNTQGRLATMDQAGRSTWTIIEAANFTLEWVNRHLSVSTTNNQQQTTNNQQPFRVQKIRPVETGDPQIDANPDPEGRGLELYTPRDIHHTVHLIGQRLIELFERDPVGTRAAVLVRENRQGRWLAETLTPLCHEHKIQMYEVGERDRRSHVPAEILALLQFLDRPHSPDYLKATLGVLVQRQLVPTQDLNALAILPEQFLYPSPLAPPQAEPVLKARYLCRSLLRARMELPHYQLISFLALALNYDQAELATADKLAERVAQQVAGKQFHGGDAGRAERNREFRNGLNRLKPKTWKLVTPALVSLRSLLCTKPRGWIGTLFLSRFCTRT